MLSDWNPTWTRHWRWPGQGSPLPDAAPICQIIETLMIVQCTIMYSWDAEVCIALHWTAVIFKHFSIDFMIFYLCRYICNTYASTNPRIQYPNIFIMWWVSECLSVWLIHGWGVHETFVTISISTDLHTSILLLTLRICSISSMPKHRTMIGIKTELKGLAGLYTYVEFYSRVETHEKHHLLYFPDKYLHLNL